MVKRVRRLKSDIVIYHSRLMREDERERLGGFSQVETRDLSSQVTNIWARTTTRDGNPTEEGK